MKLRLKLLYGLIGVACFYLLLAYIILPMLWEHHEHNPSMQSLPKVTVTVDQIPGDPLNLAFYATESEFIEAFRLAGFSKADALGLKSDLQIAESVVLNRPDETAPVSNLFLWGRKQDLAFEQEVGSSANHRHHVRFWRSNEMNDRGQILWIGSAAYDRGSGVSHLTGQITHHIDPNVDAERDYIFTRLIEAGQIIQWYQVSGVGPTRNGRNGGGDRYFTDGEISVGVISPENKVLNQPPEKLESGVLVRAKNLFFQLFSKK